MRRLELPPLFGRSFATHNGQYSFAREDSRLEQQIFTIALFWWILFLCISLALDVLLDFLLKRGGLDLQGTPA